MSTTTSTQVLPRLLHRLVTAGGTTKDDDTNNVLKICSILRQQKSLHKDEIESVTHALLILLDAPSEAHRLGALKCLLSLVKRDDDVCDVVAKSAPRFESILLTHLISSSDNRRLAMELSLCLLRHDGKLFQSEDLLNKLLESSEKEPDIYVKLLGALGDIVWSHIGSRINTAVALLVSDRTSSEAALSAVRKGWNARASLPLSLSLSFPVSFCLSPSLSLSLHLSRYVTRTHTHTHTDKTYPLNSLDTHTGTKDVRRSTTTCGKKSQKRHADRDLTALVIATEIERNRIGSRKYVCFPKGSKTPHATRTSSVASIALVLFRRCIFRCV